MDVSESLTGIGGLPAPGLHGQERACKQGFVLQAAAIKAVLKAPVAKSAAAIPSTPIRIRGKVCQEVDYC